MTDTKLSITHDKLTLKAKFDSGASLIFSIGRYGETLTTAFSNDKAVNKKQCETLSGWLESQYTGEPNIERIKRLESLCKHAKSGAELISLVELQNALV